MLVFVVFSALWMISGVLILKINSIYVSSFGFLLMALVMLILRHDLILDALFSGLLLSLVAFIFYSVFFTLIFPGIIERWWMLSNISGIQISHTPLEELMWFFGWGMVAGPAYEFVRGLGLKKTV